MPGTRSSALDRLEARIDYQASRIDALYAMLEERGIRPGAAVADRGGDAFFDELVQVEDASLLREQRRRPSRRRRAGLRVGSPGGV